MGNNSLVIPAILKFCIDKSSYFKFKSQIMQNNKLILNFAPTGMIPTKNMTPHVPITVAEIVENIHQACEVGITMVHLHARDQQTGIPTWKPDIYALMIEGIRKYTPELIVCVSTSGRTFTEFEKRGACLFLEDSHKPDMGSLTLSSLNFNKVASMNAPDMIVQLAREMTNRGIKPELEAFDAGMINFAHYLIKEKILNPPYYFNLILGNIACAQADLLHAGIMVRDLPDRSFWSFAGVGDTQLCMNSIAIAIGGGVRVGLEDNIWFDSKRTRLATNIDLIKRVHNIAKANERDIMPAKERRKYLGLKAGNGEYGVSYD